MVGCDKQSKYLSDFGHEVLQVLPRSVVGKVAHVHLGGGRVLRQTLALFTCSTFISIAIFIVLL